MPTTRHCRRPAGPGSAARPRWRARAGGRRHPAPGPGMAWRNWRAEHRNPTRGCRRGKSRSAAAATAQSMPSGVCLGPITITVRGIFSRLSTLAAIRPEKIKPGVRHHRGRPRFLPPLAACRKPSTRRASSAASARIERARHRRPAEPPDRASASAPSKARPAPATGASRL